ncbi:MAG: pyridoxal phosphate-dependent aminotransferase [Calditrichaeota bacterium]|nr:pyridoxal phosphate-dependent aminotransferase [Calditrichota bacterium]
MQLADRVRRIQSSKTVGISNTVLRLRHEGNHVVSFGAGEPDFDTPDFIKQAAIEAIQKGKTKYTQVMGIPELREAIARKLKKDNNLDFDTDQIVVSTGGKQALFNAVLSLCQEGDEVLVPTPYWVSYPEQVKLAGASPVYVPSRVENGFKITADDLKRAITSKSKLLIFNSPNNPSGAVYDREWLQDIATVLAETSLVILTDEIYEKIVFDGRTHVSLASFPEIKNRVVVVNGVSKAYAMTGWRIGYAAGPREIISAMIKIQGHSTSNPNTIAQWASVAALSHDAKEVRDMVAEFQKRRDYVYRRLSQMPGIHCRKPEGTFYIFPKVSDYFGKTYHSYRISNSFDFCQFLLEEEKVALIPGGAFGMDSFVRISFATSFQEIEEGMDRIERGLTKLYSR